MTNLWGCTRTVAEALERQYVAFARDAAPASGGPTPGHGAGGNLADAPRARTLALVPALVPNKVDGDLVRLDADQVGVAA